ncbi:hypothetical protein BDK51DRAFT_27113 [Blyttiomyces helicus]|uniref:Telomerase reverse transcriptase n=1 Tax=Blyttiomyces helicus TaxID=388810 RepID=A0A4P9W548_9FUNG|nr:hypothetical protein BDK51DRAFT_27113 [Blyttiomyces helicus]|eukprot:RKO87509.1 hypothetical protein BDK51DRAFT_27113 [Blyttiomyces helicus]
MTCVIKFYLYEKDLGSGNKGRIAFLQGVICDTIYFTHKLMQSRSRTIVAHKAGCRLDVSALQITWLGMHAFSTILRRKQTRFLPLVEWLDAELRDDRFRRVRRRLEAVVDPHLSPAFARMSF